MYQNRTTVLSIILMTLCSCSSEKSSVAYPVSTSTYDELNLEIGCDSKFIEDKKVDIFNSSHLNHWMSWKGQVLTANAEEASLNLDGKGIQDLHITFADSKGGYDLLLDEVVTVKFLMKSAGGCILPFEGVQAVVVPDEKSL